MTRTEEQTQVAEQIEHKRREFARDVDGALAASDLAPRTFRDQVKKMALELGNTHIASHAGTGATPHAGNLVRHSIQQLKRQQEIDEETRRCSRLHRTPEQLAQEAQDL